MNAEPAALTQTFGGLMTRLLRALAQVVRYAVTLYFMSVLERAPSLSKGGTTNAEPAS